MGPALTFAGDGAVLSFEAAAYVRNWRREPPEVIDVTLPYSRRSRGAAGVRVHRTRSYLHVVDGRSLPPRTTAARTAADLLRRCVDATDATACVLEFIRRRQVDSASLMREVMHDLRHPWRRLIEQMTRDAAAGLQSVLEVRYRDLEQAHGLPAGRRQAVVTRAGSKEFQDVAYDEYGVVVELDGRMNHETTDQRLRDRRRDNRNTVFGLVSLRYGYLDLVEDGCGSIKEVAAVLRRAGWGGVLRTCPECEPE